VTRRHADTAESDINVTPMLDIVFILLIFFIVTASFNRETGADVTRPEAVQAVELRTGVILIGVRADDRIWMENRAVELREVRQFVERARGENPEGSVVIVADRGSRIGTVARVAGQARLAGVEGVAIAARKPGRQLR
jgi:biopolymer transport protein ExbD